MSISIILDTNSLFVRRYNNYKELQYINNIKKLMDDIFVFNNSIENIVIGLPVIVAKELKKQQVDAYNKQIDTIKDIKFPCFEVKEKLNYGMFLDELFDNEIQKLVSYKSKILFKLIDCPESPDVLKKTIKRAIDKKPPFEGKEKQSDKGFKDVMIWESLIKYKKDNPLQSIILISNDNVFVSDTKKEDLQKEFYEIFSSKILFTKWKPSNNEELFKMISSFYNTTFVETEAMKLANKFKDVFNNDNLLELYKHYSIKNPFDSSENYYILNVTPLDYNFLGEFKPFNNEDYCYTVIEIKMELTYGETGEYASTIKFLHYPEFEICYYPNYDVFSIIGFDSPSEGEYGMRSEHFLGNKPPLEFIQRQEESRKKSNEANLNLWLSDHINNISSNDNAVDVQIHE